MTRTRTRSANREKVIAIQTRIARHFFVKEILKDNEYKSGFIVSGIPHCRIKFFPEAVTMEKYISDWSQKDLYHAMQRTYIFSCQVEISENERYIVVKFLC